MSFIISFFILWGTKKVVRYFWMRFGTQCNERINFEKILRKQVLSHWTNRIEKTSDNFVTYNRTSNINEWVKWLPDTASLMSIITYVSNILEMLYLTIHTCDKNVVWQMKYLINGSDQPVGFVLTFGLGQLSLMQIVRYLRINFNTCVKVGCDAITYLTLFIMKFVRPLIFNSWGDLLRASFEIKSSFMYKIRGSRGSIRNSGIPCTKWSLIESMVYAMHCASLTIWGWWWRLHVCRFDTENRIRNYSILIYYLLFIITVY